MVQDHPFANLVIKAVIVCFGIWGSVVVADLAGCEAKTPGKCEAQRSEVRNAATAIPSTLLAWLADSPLTGKTTAAKVSRTRPKEDEQSV